MCSLFSGSSGNCSFVETDKEKLLIDAGVTSKRIVGALDSIGVTPEEIKAILVTHEHTDHTASVGILSRKFNLPIVANELTWNKMLRDVGKIHPRNVKVILPNSYFSIGDIKIKSFPVPHDSVCPVGYSFSYQGVKASIITDVGHITKDLLRNVLGSKMVILEANHDINRLIQGSYPNYLKIRIKGDMGHLSNHIAAKMAAKLVSYGAKQIILAHLSMENNSPDLVMSAVEEELAKIDTPMREKLSIMVAPPDHPSEFMETSASEQTA